MSSKKKAIPQYDSDEDDELNNIRYSTVSHNKSQRFKSPKQPWKSSTKGSTMATSSFMGTTVGTQRRQADKYNLPSQTCAREKQELRHSICQLEENIRQKNLRIKQLKDNLNQEKLIKEEINEQVISNKEWKNVAEQLKQDNHSLKSHEIQLHNELQEQQLLTKEALTRLYEYREESLAEKEKLREMYEQYAEDRVQEERLNNMEQINNLLDLNDKLRSQVAYVEQQMESIKKQEKLINQVHNYKSAIQMKKQLQDYEDKKLSIIETAKYNQDQYLREIEKLRLENLVKERAIAERDQDYVQRERKIKQQLELDQSRRMVDFQLENDYLRKELDYKSEELRHSAKKYKQKKTDLNSSYHQLQSQLSNMKYDLEEIKYENRKILENVSPLRRK